jgi:hypothetical protein
MKTVFAIRHVAFEDLDSFAPTLMERGYTIRYLEAGQDDLAALDPLAGDLWVVLGGPIGVYEEEAYPFIRDELRLLQARLEAGRPTLGICLGAQLIASALGARVYPGGRKEIGWKPLALTEACQPQIAGKPKECPVERESMEYDVVIVGAGPSGLSAAIPSEATGGGQYAARMSTSACWKKAPRSARTSCPARSSSPRALNELIPDWKERGAPLNTPAGDDRFLFLTRETSYRRLPTPPQMNNHGNYIVSLGNVCRWLATQAEALGVEIYPGFAAAEVLYNDDRRGGRRRHRRHGRRPRRQADRSVRAGHGTARPLHAVRRGLPRLADQNPVRALQAARGRGPADLRHRHQGTVGDRSRPAPAGQDRPHRRLAAGPQHLWRLVPLSSGEQPGGGRASSSASTTKTRICRRSTNSSASRPIPIFARLSRAGGASPTARAPSPPAASSRSPS